MATLKLNIAATTYIECEWLLQSKSETNKSLQRILEVWYNHIPSNSF